MSPLSTVAIYQRLVVAGGSFFLLLDLGPGPAACEIGVEVNTGYSLNFCGLFPVAQVPRWPKFPVAQVPSGPSSQVAQVPRCSSSRWPKFPVAQVPSGRSSQWPKVSWPKFARPGFRGAATFLLSPSIFPSSTNWTKWNVQRFNYFQRIKMGVKKDLEEAMCPSVTDT